MDIFPEKEAFISPEKRSVHEFLKFFAVSTFSGHCYTLCTRGKHYSTLNKRSCFPRGIIKWEVCF